MAHSQTSTRRPGFVRSLTSPTALLVLLAVTSWSPVQALTPELEWSHPDVIGDLPETSLAVTGIAPGPAGHVAIDTTPFGEENAELTTTVWYSVDGFEWGEIATLADVGLTSVVHAHDVYVAVGRRDLGGLQTAPAVWTSPDGRTWTASSDVPPILGPATADGPAYTGSWMVDVAATDGGFVAIGQAAGTGAAWMSTDGISWAAVAGTPFGSDAVDLRGISFGARVLVAIGHTATDADSPGPLRTWWSANGERWTEAPPDARFDVLGEGPLGAQVIWHRDRYVLLGTLFEGPRAWTSADGKAWTDSVALPHEGGSGWGYVVDVATDDRTLIAVGDDQDGDGRGASIWASGDGETWGQVAPTDLRGSLTQAAVSTGTVYKAGNHWVVLGSAWDYPAEAAIDVRWIGWPPGAERFIDVLSDHTFVDDVEWLAAEGISRGCNPPANTMFCPDLDMTRGQMAALLVRAMDYADDGGGDLFVDDDHSVFETDIDKLGTAGVTKGCNPPVNDRYCPDDVVSRGQMAGFLVRAIGCAHDGDGDLFVDDDHSVFETDIDKLGTAGVTKGCNPPVNDRYCPDDLVTRAQMAAFLHRALDG